MESNDDFPLFTPYYEEIDTRFNLNISKKTFKKDARSSVNISINPKKTVKSVLQNRLQESMVSVSGDNMRPTNNSDDHNVQNNKKENSDHYKTFKSIDNLIMVYGLVVGFAISKRWKYNNATRWTKIMLIFGTAITVYSHLIVISQPSKLIEVFSLFGMILPAFLKFNLYVRSHKKALSVNSFIECVFKINDEGPMADVLKTHVNGCFTNIKIFVVIQSLALLVFVCYPAYGYVANNELIQLMPMEFPFLDQTTTTGFIVGGFIMAKMGVWAYTGCVCFDIILAKIIYNYIALVKLLQQDLLDYAEMCKNIDYSDNYRKLFFRNFLLKCQDKDRYMQFVNATYAEVIFEQFSIAYVCLIFAIYAIIRSNWYSGCGFALFCLTEIYILCIIGSTIQIENDKFCAAIYDVPWYDYPVSMQQALKILLHSSQNARELWIGPFAPLNVESGLKITKSIYSTSTVIINTSE